MKKGIIAAVIIVVIISIILAWYFLKDGSDTPEELNEASPLDEEDSDVLYTGTFNSSAHHAEGSAYLIDVNGSLTLRFEDFATDDGPGIYVYLSPDLTNNDYINLGKLKALKGNMNYNVPAGTDLEKYDSVLIWCEPANALLGYAEMHSS